jgi:putative Ca2+/H+ antiporter (TMEM165/GDT1 family)
MYKLVEFFQKRPSDMTIRMMKILMGLIIIALLGIYFNDFTLPVFPDSYALYVKYALFILGVMPLFGGITGLCMAKRKTMRIMQLIMGILFIVFGNLITMDTPVVVEAPKPVVQSGSEIDYNATLNQQDVKVPSKPLNIGAIIAWLSIFPLFGGITGKCITEKCLKYGEIIKKIRV